MSMCKSRTAGSPARVQGGIERTTTGGAVARHETFELGPIEAVTAGGDGWRIAPDDGEHGRLRMCHGRDVLAGWAICAAGAREARAAGTCMAAGALASTSGEVITFTIPSGSTVSFTQMSTVPMVFFSR